MFNIKTALDTWHSDFDARMCCVGLQPSHFVHSVGSEIEMGIALSRKLCCSD